MSLKLHIISSDVPYPPDYGGMIDVFYTVKNLHALGVKIYLHCFEYGRGEPAELNDICEELFFYKRKIGIQGIVPVEPYMMSSRRSNDLLRNLQQIDAPILFEGIHTCFYLDHPSLKNRFKIVRNQNLEQSYYQQLSQKAESVFEKIYYSVEARLLRKKEAKLHSADAFFTLASHEYDFFKRAYPQKLNKYIPGFHPYNEVLCQLGLGNYVLYHGNLSHPENIEAAQYILNNISNRLPQVQFIFAGKNPEVSIQKVIDSQSNCLLISNPSMEEMEQLVADAQIHLLPTFQPTGLKLKLLHALFRGRHILVNPEMLVGSGLDALCTISNNSEEFIQSINQYIQLPFNKKSIEERKGHLMKLYNNVSNAQSIIDCLNRK